MTSRKLTQKRLKKVLRYNPGTGLFIRLVATANSVKVGDIAGYKQGNGYIYIMVDGTKYCAHRLAFLYMTGKFPKDQTDHINHVRDDNRWNNLREATNSINSKNLHMRSNNTSGYMGVSWDKYFRKWNAYIKVNYKRVNLGYYFDKTDAIAAREVANIKHGFHENHGATEEQTG